MHNARSRVHTCGVIARSNPLISAVASRSQWDGGMMSEGTHALRFFERARASERLRVAREVHDVLGHHLTALSIHLDLARRTATDQPLRSSLDQAHAEAQRMLGELRATVCALRADSATSLRSALEGFTRAIPSLRVELHFPEALSVGDAPAHVALRCVQEAVTNALKHADAAHVTVSVSRDGSTLVVIVDDDGKRAGHIRDGNGLRGMRERVREIGGTLEIESVAGRGTRVHLRLPTGAS